MCSIIEVGYWFKTEVILATKTRLKSAIGLFDTQMVFLKDFFRKSYFEKKSSDDKSMKNFPVS